MVGISGEGEVGGVVVLPVGDVCVVPLQHAAVTMTAGRGATGSAVAGDLGVVA